MKEDSTREKILSAARDAFSSKGYTRSTTKDISKAAGIAEITLFRHFETKSNLFYETISKYLILPMLDSNVLDSSVDAKQAIINLTQERIDTLRNNKDLFICTVYEAQFNDEIKDMLQMIHSKIFDVIKLYLEFNREDTNDVTVEQMAQIFLSTIVGVMIFETIGGSSNFMDSEDLIRTIRTMVFE